MDPDANRSEQIEIANEVMKLWDECGDDGEFTDVQESQLVAHAYRLSELALALFEWQEGRAS